MYIHYVSWCMALWVRMTPVLCIPNQWSQSTWWIQWNPARCYQQCYCGTWQWQMFTQAMCPGFFIIPSPKWQAAILQHKFQIQRGSLPQPSSSPRPKSSQSILCQKDNFQSPRFQACFWQVPTCHSSTPVLSPGRILALQCVLDLGWHHSELEWL